ncbi:DUF92 domain-containing protein [Neolewinella xylanilytica]|uniref:DUF92 domain-containing protein n=1 Tax=Neolewinella xylanilytica TaxID=1514080 RepID=UPI0014728A1C|nr:DUF92 domain-containing protein [Neolewinella xylanilytica]
MEHVYEVAIWIVLCISFAGVTVRQRSLSISGAVAAVVLASVVVGSRGYVWLLPLFGFFLSSSLIGRLLPVELESGDPKDKLPRDAVQVLCNGGLFGLLALFGSPPSILLLSLAIAASDTWASEIGRYFRQPTYDIVRGKRVPSGLSGGVSLAGSLAGIGGATFIAQLGFALPDDYGWTHCGFVAGLGTVGMLVDSLLGALLQARYRDKSGALTDKRGESNTLVSGLGWMSNDLVNLASIGLTVAVALLVAPRL